MRATDEKAHLPGRGLSAFIDGDVWPRRHCPVPRGTDATGVHMPQECPLQSAPRRGTREPRTERRPG